MRHTFARLSLAGLLVALLTGPVLAAPLVVGGPTLSAADTPHSSPGHSVATWVTFSVLALGGTITIRDTGTLANKYVTRAGQAAGDYKTGIQGSGGKWEAGAKAGEGNYEQGVQAAIGRKAYGKGVSGSAGLFEKNASELGSTRYGPGVANAKDRWAQGVQPSLDRLKSLDLPPKGPRRSPQNQARANAVALALGALKEGK